MKSLEELTSNSEIASWVKADIFADTILEGLVCYGQLSGKITALEYDLTAGGGDTVQVKYVEKRTNSCTSMTGSCLCLSDTSTTFGTYDIKINAWGDYDVVCGYSEWKADGDIMPLIMNEMAKRMAECRDEEIYNNLVTNIGTPNIDKESKVSCADGVIAGSCCTFTYELYNSIVTVMKHMQGDSYEPDYVILHPDVAKYLYFKDGTGYFYSQIPGTSYSEDGKLQTLAGLKVIECCNANDCSDNAGEVQAVIIDSRRAVGEAWGKRPTFTEFYENYCDRTRLVLWQYWGSAALDSDAVGWVSNP